LRQLRTGIQAEPGQPKKYFEKVANFPKGKSVRQHTTIHQQSTTTSPQKHHTEDALFRKTPAKAHSTTQQKIL